MMDIEEGDRRDFYGYFSDRRDLYEYLNSSPALVLEYSPTYSGSTIVKEVSWSRIITRIMLGVCIYPAYALIRCRKLRVIAALLYYSMLFAAIFYRQYHVVLAHLILSIYIISESITLDSKFTANSISDIEVTKNLAAIYIPTILSALIYSLLIFFYRISDWLAVIPHGYAMFRVTFMLSNLLSNLINQLKISSARTILTDSESVKLWIENRDKVNIRFAIARYHFSVLITVSCVVIVPSVFIAIVKSIHGIDIYTIILVSYSGIIALMVIILIFMALRIIQNINNYDALMNYKLHAAMNNIEFKVDAIIDYIRHYENRGIAFHIFGIPINENIANSVLLSVLSVIPSVITLIISKITH